MHSDPKNRLAMRPVYDWVSEDSPEEFIARLSQLASFDPAVEIHFRPRHAVLRIPVEARHTWSPILDITALEHGAHTHVHARLGPEPEVWGTLMFLNAASFLPCMFAGMFGVAQHLMGETPYGLIALPVGAAALAAIYTTSHIGRSLGASQIHQLLALVEANLGVDAAFVEDSTSLVPPHQGGIE